MDIDSFFDAELDEHAAVFARTRAVLKQPFGQWVAMALATIRAGGRARPHHRQFGADRDRQ